MSKKRRESEQSFIVLVTFVCISHLKHSKYKYSIGINIIKLCKNKVIKSNYILKWNVSAYKTGIVQFYF